MNVTIRKASSEDASEILRLAEESGIFDADGLSLVQTKLSEMTSAKWLVAVNPNVVGVIYGDLEPVTEGTWNALMLLVQTDQRGKGIGRMLMNAFEAEVKSEGARIVLVDTSSGEDFETARALYSKLGFTQEAQVRDYYADGYDKVTFWKRL
jgi:ribosomal protein S18 acetylase RimI-like enzyme